ncbi:MAG TPA: metalloregulator ArsR/SmtB family transcription factor [Polyangiaceae bacterium]|nr:metalloregulator ArsR/SmtB family transcription factor [Polyangiaceae bacterium]
MRLDDYAGTLSLLGDENRLRLCALLKDRELCVTDLVRVTGIAQSRVSTHLGRLREAGLVRDRRKGPQSFYALATEALSETVRSVVDDAARSHDPTIEGDRERLAELERERKKGVPESFIDEIERDYSPGRTWRSLALGVAALLDLGDVIDVGSGDGAAASAIAPYCGSLTCVDSNEKMIEAASERLSKFENARAKVADAQALPFPDGSFDAALVLHTLTYAEDPERVLAETARVLRPGGRVVVECLNAHRRPEVTTPYGERHRGFSPRALRKLLESTGFDVRTSEVACRESKKPHLEVVLGIGTKPGAAPKKKRERP